MRKLKFSLGWVFIAAVSQLTLLSAEPVEWQTFAGNYGGQGIKDGPAIQSRFYRPMGMAPDGAGGVYITDIDAHTIRRISPEGVVSTLTGTPGVSGNSDGSPGTALLNRPVVICNAGAFLFLVDLTAATNFGRLRQVSLDGTVSTLAGVPQGITSIAGLPDGTLYLSYSSEHVIRRRTAAGEISVIAGVSAQSGSVNGAGGVARFRFPGALTLDQSGNLFISDGGNYLLRKMAPDGEVSTLAGSAGKSGSADGTGTVATFSGIAAITVDASGNVYASGGANGNIRRITPAGVVSTLAGGSSSVHGWKDGVGRNASFRQPLGIAFQEDGSLLIADGDALCIRRMTPDLTVTTYAGRPFITGELNGTGTAAQMMGPDKSAVDTSGNLYFIDKLRVRKVTPAGSVTTIAGDPYLAGSANGTGTAATFNYPRGLALDKSGNLYVADTGNHTIRKITPSRVVTTLAGRAGEFGGVNGTGSAARFESPNDVTLGPDGSLYVTDQNRAVRKVTTSGVVTTYAGILGDYGTNDGLIASARFLSLSASAFDAEGNLYVLDQGAHNIRKVLADRSRVFTLCGLAGEAGYADGTGPAARFDQPLAIAVAPDSMIYIADLANNLVRRVTPEGAVTTVGGSPVDNLERLSDAVGGEARFNGITGLSVSADGSIYLSDAGNARLVKGNLVKPVELTAVPQTVTFPEDTAYSLLLEATGGGEGAVSFAVVTPPAHGALSGTAPNLVYTPAADYFGTDTFSFKAVSGSAESAPATVSLVVTNVNDPPVAFDQTESTNEDTPVIVSLRGFDAEGEIDERSFEILTQPSHGTVTGSAASITYLPDANYFGPDSFTFVARDYTSRSAPAVVTINVLPVNDAPVAAAQALTTNEDTSLPVTLTATDVERDALTFEITAAPEHGTLSGTAPNLTYTPATDYFGPDSFSFSARDATLSSSPARISLTVLPVNDAPVAAAQALTTNEDIALPVTLTATDVESDALTFEITAAPRHGTLSGTAPNLTYTPAADYFGPDSFSFRARDATLPSTPAQISLTVLPVNDAPTVLEPLVDVLQTRPGLTSSLPLPPHFRDVETASDLLTFSLQAEGGESFFAFSIEGGTLTLTGTAAGFANLMITAADPEGLAAGSGFRYRVKHLPELAGGGAGIPTQRAILEKPPVRIDLAAWFSDADGDSLTYSLVANSNSAAASSVLTDSTLTLTGLAPGTTRITVRATDSDEGTLDHSFDVVSGTEFPTITAGGMPVIDSQSGLLLQKVTVINTTGLLQNGFRLLVSGMPGGTSLHNATVPQGAWIDWTASMELGAQVVLTLEFYSPSRSGNFTPVLSAGNALSTAGPAGDGKGMAVRRIVALKDGGVLLEFESIPGHWYQVEYTSDFATWKNSPTPVHTGANRTQWIDRGPPGTDSPPSASSARMYRIKDVTPTPF